MKNKKLLAFCLVLILLCANFCGCSNQKSKQVSLQKSVTKTTQSTTKNIIKEIDKMIENMTLKEKIGQLFIVRPDTLGCKTSISENLETSLSTYPVGGIVIFANNITSPEQLNGFINSFQKSSKIPMFISIDEEGGSVTRLASHYAFDLTEYESAAAVGKNENPDDAQKMGSTIGEYLKKYGFNMDFAPCADINTNPNNPVIGDRAFSSSAVIGDKMAKAMANGLKSQNIIPVFKHFPGHGDTAEDSHSGIAINNKTKQQLLECELLPYKNLSDKDCVMVGHIATPNITNNLTPATLNKEIVSNILRDELKFNGLIVTDSLEMGAIANEYSLDDACVLAVLSGCDVLLDPPDIQVAFDGIENAVENGKISMSRLDEIVKRILFFKKTYGLIK